MPISFKWIYLNSLCYTVDKFPGWCSNFANISESDVSIKVTQDVPLHPLPETKFGIHRQAKMPMMELWDPALWAKGSGRSLRIGRQISVQLWTPQWPMNQLQPVWAIAWEPLENTDLESPTDEIALWRSNRLVEMFQHPIGTNKNMSLDTPEWVRATVWHDLCDPSLKAAELKAKKDPPPSLTSTARESERPLPQLCRILPRGLISLLSFERTRSWAMTGSWEECQIELSEDIKGT